MDNTPDAGEKPAASTIPPSAKKGSAWLPDFGVKGWGITAFGLFFFYWCFSIFDVGM